MYRTDKGFSFIELMVAITIVAMLAAIGVPFYKRYVIKSHRNEARVELLSAANAANNYKLKHGEFPTGNINSFWHEKTKNKYYTLSYYSGVSQNSADVSYKLTAVAEGSQALDINCKTIEFELDGGIIDKTPAQCWN